MIKTSQINNLMENISDCIKEGKRRIKKGQSAQYKIIRLSKQRRSEGKR